MIHRQLFKKLSQNLEHFQTHCNNRNNPFRFASRNCYLYNNYKNSYTINLIITPAFI